MQRISNYHVLGLAIVLTLAGSVSTIAQDDAVTNPETKDIDFETVNELFQDKIVALKVDESSVLNGRSSGVYLHDCQLKQLGGRLFVTGKAYIPDHPKYKAYEYRRDLFTAVAWNKVHEFALYSEEQYLTYVKNWIERTEDSGERQ